GSTGPQSFADGRGQPVESDRRRRGNLRRQVRQLARGRYPDAARRHVVHPAVVGRAAADQSEQHDRPAGARDADGTAYGRRQHRQRPAQGSGSADYQREDAKGELMRREHGFWILEMIVWMGAILYVTGGIFALMN